MIANGQSVLVPSGTVTNVYTQEQLARSDGIQIEVEDENVSDVVAGTLRYPHHIDMAHRLQTSCIFIEP